MTRRSTRRWARVVAILWLAGVLASCAQSSSTTSTTPAVSPPGATCAPTDQDQYVYDPHRLQLVTPCIRVTGRVDALLASTDGDSIILLHLDPPYQHLLTPGNSVGEDHGDLGIEAVCTHPALDAIVMALCASDPDPYPGPFPPVGAHVWIEGRYILDLNHESHAELHPLYRVGTL